MAKGATTPDEPGSTRRGPVPDAGAVVDPRGVVLALSRGTCRLLGYELVEVVGRAAKRLLAEPLPAPVRRSCAERESWSGPVTVRRADGDSLLVTVQGHPLQDTAGDTYWFLTVVSLDQAGVSSASGGALDTALFKQWALEQLPLPMALYDRAGVRFEVNAAMTRESGRADHDLIGWPLGQSASGQTLAGSQGVDETLRRVLTTGDTVTTELHGLGPGGTAGRVWLLSLYPVRDPGGQVCGMSAAAVDTTEQFRARRRLTILNDAGLRIGTTLDLGRTADELAEVGTDHFADFAVVDLLDSVLRGEETAAGRNNLLVFRRTAQRSVLPGCPESVVPLGATYSYPEDSPPGRALAAGRGALHSARDILQWWEESSPERAHSIRTYGIHSLMAVPLRARGVTLGLALFFRHRTPVPFEEDDLRLAEELGARAAVLVDNARRYGRERATALALQRSILPQHPALHHSAVEVASRYLPAHSSAGVGGDWFDVIPLSGARVALVVGDVVGHGIRASATMGRLCTAVRTLADVDLAPDELLTHLDDLVLRMDREETVDRPDHPGDLSGEVGASCLYAVYDPVSRRCSMARAGHPLPALATPDGAVRFLDLPTGPPLGLGGLPFEVAEFTLPEGSVLALYTDGLIESQARDVDEACDLLRAALADPDRPLEETCDRTLRDLLPDARTDDVALLLTRTRALSTDQVATWELPAEPSVVARARGLAGERLAAWHLEEASFTAELVVSELVTNAIRYGSPPIHLRLIRDTALICEVSDVSSTAPHLRRARLSDEGGRGLLIVAQLSQRWGSRHTRTGKTIWAELPLPPAQEAS
ncbi:ATP-binding SpoIIE family protein phosphatase [Streptomyces mirabilis]|uniref:ATP-binding SpoIIE family protein phosphatase n=1 Tax=Streptomyces mirabilis TaxID=68239 RepID=UPI0036E57B25